MSAAKSSTKPTHIRQSRVGRWRAATLITVQLLMVAHYVQWRSTGSTLSPIEPSESMQTLEAGFINAGFIFFAIAILSTALFGRWMCGWACHLVAVQDFCAWILKKLGLRPKPIRSRLLLWVPTVAAFYMFLYPTLERIVVSKTHPEWVWRLRTENFWATFPNWQIATLTFVVCGFLMVYFLGSKGFCSYGCPYGGLFVHVERLAPMRIRVNENCDQCGHCTAVCTSNVRVHEEVKLLKMVVDPGCMKCMDCVSVCPRGALSVGWGSPFARGAADALKASQKERRVFDFSWLEELFLLATFLGTFWTVRGLYDAIPFLLSVGIGSLSAFALLFAVRSLRATHYRMQRWTLVRGGKRSGAGWLYLASMVAWLIFLGHSAVVQWHVKAADAALLEATAAAKDVANGSTVASAKAQIAASEFAAANALALFPVAEWQYKEGSAQQFLGHFDQAKANFSRALELDSNRPVTRRQLAQLYFVTGDFAAAMEQFEKLAKSGVDLKENWREFGLAAIRNKSFETSIEPLRKTVDVFPDSADSRLNLGMALAELGRYDDSIRELTALVERFPDNPVGWLNLGLTQAAAGKASDAEASLRRSLQAKPSASAFAALGRLEAETGRIDLGLADVGRAVTLEPLNPAVITDAVEVASNAKALANWTKTYKIRGQSDRRFLYILSALLRRQAQIAQADAELARARQIEPNLPTI